MFRMSYYEHPSYVPWLRRRSTCGENSAWSTALPSWNSPACTSASLGRNSFLAVCAPASTTWPMNSSTHPNSLAASRCSACRPLCRNLGTRCRLRPVRTCRPRHAQSGQGIGAEVRTDDPVTSWTAESNLVHVAAGAAASAKTLSLPPGPGHQPSSAISTSTSP